MADGDWEQRWDPEQSRQYLYNPVTKERKEMESSAAEDSSLSSEGTQQTAWIGKHLGWPQPNFLSPIIHYIFPYLVFLERWDDDSGYPYWENRNTGDIVWEKPTGADDNEAAAVTPGWTQWVEKFDDESGYPYYENQETGEMVWEKPLGFDEQGDHSAPDTHDVATYEWVEKIL